MNIRKSLDDKDGVVVHGSTSSYLSLIRNTTHKLQLNDWQINALQSIHNNISIIPSSRQVGSTTLACLLCADYLSNNNTTSNILFAPTNIKSINYSKEKILEHVSNINNINIGHNTLFNTVTNSSIHITTSMSSIIGQRYNKIIIDQNEKMYTQLNTSSHDVIYFMDEFATILDDYATYYIGDNNG